MSSFDVSVVWLCDGQTPEEAIAAHTAGYLQLDDDAPVLVPAPRGDPPEPGEEWDEFLPRAVQALRLRFPDVEVVDQTTRGSHLRELVVADELGLVVALTPGIASVETGAGGHWDVDRAWRYLQILARLRPSVVWYSDEDEVVDIDLDAAAARSLYGW